MVHVSTSEQRSGKQESKAKKTTNLNGFIHSQNGSKHDNRNAPIAVVTKNGELNFGFEQNSDPDKVIIVMSDNDTKGDDNPDVTLKRFRPITEQDGTMDPNNTNNNSNYLSKPGLSIKGRLSFTFSVSVV